MQKTTFARGYDLFPIVTQLEEVGGPEAVARVFQEQDLPVQVLENRDTFVPFRDLAGAYERAAQLTGDRLFGVHSGQHYRFSELGAYSTYVLQAVDLGTAIRRGIDNLSF